VKARAEYGHRYRARIEVGWLQRAFANVAMIAGKLSDIGMVNISVLKISAGVYQAEATWLGALTSVDLPDEVVSVEDLGQVQ
jgi:hypothetical protein